jgi:hypothetical protein
MAAAPPEAGLDLRCPLDADPDPDPDQLHLAGQVLGEPIQHCVQPAMRRG